jgi:hypothetical protein
VRTNTGPWASRALQRPARVDPVGIDRSVASASMPSSGHFRDGRKSVQSRYVVWSQKGGGCDEPAEASAASGGVELICRTS